MRRMKGYAALCFVIACSPDHHHTGQMIDASRADAAPVDASWYVCRSPSGTASILVDDHGAQQTWTRLAAGGMLWGGAVVAGPPMSLSLLFTDTDPLDGQVGQCCANGDATCCTVGGVRATTQQLGAGTEVGQHVATIGTFNNSFPFDGQLTITYFVQPFDSAPGRITGSISGSVAGQSVSGEFDNTFCSALLTQTI